MYPGLFVGETTRLTQTYVYKYTGTHGHIQYTHIHKSTLVSTDNTHIHMQRRMDKISGRWFKQWLL